MPLPITFRAVGIYSYFDNIVLNDLDGTSTILQILDALKTKYPAFSFNAGPTREGKLIVTEIGYDFSAASSQPPNVSGPPILGPRSLDTVISQGTSQVWQYYRSAIFSDGTSEFEVRNRTIGQPSFALTPIGSGLITPAGAHLVRYKLVFRNVSIELSPEKQIDYLNAKMVALTGA